MRHDSSRHGTIKDPTRHGTLLASVRNACRIESTSGPEPTNRDQACLINLVLESQLSKDRGHKDPVSLVVSGLSTPKKPSVPQIPMTRWNDREIPKTINEDLSDS